MPSATTTFETILLEREGAIGTITLNRPKVLNALNAQLLGELESALDELAADTSIRVVILTGAGEKAFAAGADIGGLNVLPNAHEGMKLARRGQALTLKMERMRTPIIGAINGFALGGGCEIAMATDIRIASENAKFGQPEVNLGLMPGYGGTQRMARLIGRGMAMHLCLTAEMLDAQDALRVGLVQKVLPLAGLLDEARRVAGLIAAKAPLAIELTKRAMAEGLDVGLYEGLTIEALNFGLLVDTADFKEGTSAFLERRAATFTGT